MVKVIGLISFFNGISNIMGYLIPKPFVFVWNSLEEQIQERRLKLVLVNHIKCSPLKDFAIPADH